MSRWQRKARLVIAVGATAFAVFVAFAYRGRPPAPVTRNTTASDPKAAVETTAAQTIRLNLDREEVRIQYKEMRSYPEGGTVLLGVKVVTERGGGRTFTITANQGDVGQNESTYHLTGDVQIAASDGLVVRTDSATWSEREAVVRAPGPLSVGRGGLSGWGVGVDYDQGRNVVSLLDQVVVRLAPDGTEAGLEIAAPVAELHRVEHVVVFSRGMTAVRGGELVQGDAASARLSPDEDRLEAVELRGRSRIAVPATAAGGLEALTGRDMNLKYGADGRSIEHALIVGDAVTRLKGEGRQPGGRISADSIDVTLAPDGSSPVGLAARDNVELALPGARGGPARTVRSRTLDARGEAGRGLRQAFFTGEVQFSERGADVDRAARSAELEVALGPGLATIDEAKFKRGVRFVDRDMTATAAAARYKVLEGGLELSGSEPGAEAPRIVNNRIAVNATLIDVTLAGPVVEATGAVESVLKPAPAEAPGQPARGTRTPSLLEADQPVIVAAGRLNYDGKAGTASYAEEALLTQGETSIKGETLVLDERTGDLSAGGPVTSVVMLDDEGEGGTMRRSRTMATGNDLKYEEEQRRATYTGDAHMVGAEGDLTAARIDMILASTGDQLERLEAHEKVSLRDEKGRKTTGARMRYFSADRRYEMIGTPVQIIDECGSESSGRMLTWFRGVDRIIIDGEQHRTQTRGAKCP